MDGCIERIREYLRDGDIKTPLFVNVENTDQKMTIYDYFNVGDNAIVHVTDFAKKDSLPNIMALIDRLKKSQKNIFVFGLTTYLRLIGNNELQKTMQTLCDMRVAKKTVIVCYHCDEILKKLIQRDLRVIHQVVTVDTREEFVKPHITFLSPEFVFSLEATKMISGIENLADAIEQGGSDEIYVRTASKPQVFAKGQYAISVLSTPLQILQNKFPELNIFAYREEDGEYWKYLLDLSEGKASFKAVVLDHFGDKNSYEYALQEWSNYDDKHRWLLFIAMKVFPDSKNQIIRDMVEKSDAHVELVRSMVRTILNYSHDDKDYRALYKQWKSLRGRLSVLEEEIVDYCEFVDHKGKEAIYYLSDLSKQEKEKAIKLIGKYQADLDDKTLRFVLQENFPDFYNYINPYYYNNELLDGYFSQYTMQKLRNVIYPEFEELVNQEAVEHHYVELPSRAEVVGGLDKKDAILYFVDALGVEFLNYILQKCADKGLFAEPKVAKCNLPSITEKNKEFLSEFKAYGAEIVDFIKQIDKDKHEAIGDYSFEKSEYPLHLIDELEPIDKVLSNISAKLATNKYRHAYIISDHGASRLAVIKKSILPIESNRTGTHGGRVCENNDVTKGLSYAVHEGKLCILAGYDRFDGSRPAAVETHGGATLEEVVVPVIRITRNNVVWEFKVMNENNKVVFSYKTAPVLVIWSKNEIRNLSIKVDGKPYTGVSDEDKKTFRFYLDRPESACDCIAEIYVSNNLVKTNVKFRLEREGFQKSSGLGFGNIKIGGFDK